MEAAKQEIPKEEDVLRSLCRVLDLMAEIDAEVVLRPHPHSSPARRVILNVSEWFNDPGATAMTLRTTD